MLQKHKVYEVVDHLKDWKIIQNQWVFDAKPDGQKKACLVVKGFSQVDESDFDQIFSPVMHLEIVQLMLGLAAFEDWYISGLNVKSTYLYGELNEEIYMEQSEGFKIPGQENKVLCLQGALYRLNRLD